MDENIATDTVSFTSMAAGTRADYELLAQLETEFAAATADRVLRSWPGCPVRWPAYRVDRLEHSLQAATRAYRDDADEEMVVAALLHDIGDLLSPHNHSELAAAVLRPYVSDALTGLSASTGCSRATTTPTILATTATPRDRYRNHPWYQDAVDFCHRWDQPSFDPAYASLPLAFFEPMVRRIFAREPFGLAGRSDGISCKPAASRRHPRYRVSSWANCRNVRRSQPGWFRNLNTPQAQVTSMTKPEKSRRLTPPGRGLLWSHIAATLADGSRVQPAASGSHRPDHRGILDCAGTGRQGAARFCRVAAGVPDRQPDPSPYQEAPPS